MRGLREEKLLKEIGRGQVNQKMKGRKKKRKERIRKERTQDLEWNGIE